MPDSLDDDFFGWDGRMFDLFAIPGWVSSRVTGLMPLAKPFEPPEEFLVLLTS
jgi:hypothetical protein